VSFLDDLRALRTTPQAIWMEFLGVYSVASFDIYLFFEGKDDFAFYQPFVRNAWSRGKSFGFNCEGKDEVIAIIPKVKKKLDYQWRALFFLDKDIDDLCGGARHSDPYLYETECYSIENFVASRSTLSIIWTDLLQLPQTDPRYATVHSAFDTAYETFCVAMQSVMAWVIQLRRAGHRVVLNDVSMNNLLELDQDCKCTLKSGWAEHILAASNTHGMSFDPVLHGQVVSELDGRDPKTYIRGKFDLWYFVSFLQKTLQVLAERVTGLPRATCSIQIGHGNAIDALSARIKAPDSLRNFLASALPA
jgi:hypothetical protein